MEIVKNIKKNSLILILITLIVLYIILGKDLSNIIYYFKIMDYKYIFIAILLYFVYLILHSYVVFITVNKKEKFTFKDAIKNNIIVQFFNGITPFSTGGQPMEIYLLTRYGISSGRATNYIIQNFVFYQIALVLLGLFAIIINFFCNLFPKVSFIRELVLIGFLINTFVAIVLLIISFSKKGSKTFVTKIIDLLAKLKIVKNKEKEYELWNARLEEFNRSADELKLRKNLFIMGVVLNFIGLFCLYLIPLFIAYALHDFDSLNILNTVVSSAYVMVMGNFVPIPGGSGGIEYGFANFFGTFITKSMTSTILLIWRFITYYLGMIMGSIMFNFSNIKEDSE